MFWKISLFALALLSLSAPLIASVIYVSGDQTGTWAADTVIVTGEVRVPPGQMLTISPGVEVLFTVYCKLIVDNGATLRAIGTPVDSIRFDVLPPDTAWHGIRFLSASDSSRLEYCILTHGRATGGGNDAWGGAIYCFNSDPNISHNTISGNSAMGRCFNGARGGGIFCVGSSPTISGNTISENSAISSGTGAGLAKGGGICCDSSSPTIIGNLIRENSVSGGGIGNEGSGGGILCENNSNATISGNTISENLVSGPYQFMGSGGGISCSNSSPTINNNIISGNSAASLYSATPGGGISCGGNSSPIISGNIISGNSAFGIDSHGGGVASGEGNPIISGNTINENESDCGGGIACGDSAIINGNIISWNCADLGGGGISCNGGSIIIGNTISRNSVGLTSGGGGGIYCGMGSPSIHDNTISGNSAETYGGGIYCWFSNPTIIGSTICQNTASIGSDIYCYANSNPTLINCILWSSATPQIYGSPTVTYSDIQGGYAGTGNINLWPAFVDTAQSDYRLQWGSPCIDTGDPNPIYNDPDGSRADMGAWYYDQSLPVRILLTPYNAPIQIPASGGSFQYAIQATNIESDTLSAVVWCNATLPSGAGTAPLLGPVTISLGAGQTLSRVRTQAVPANAPSGMYHYNAYAVAAGDTSQDNFVFTKLGAGGWGLDAGGWTNTGESFDLAGVVGQLAAPMPADVGIAASPNPFNPTTAISYELRAASFVSLKVYDTAGRLVTTLVDGWRDAGAHQIAFDGSGLPSGIYFAKLTAGDFSQVQKLVLLK